TDEGGQVSQAARVTPFVVVPAEYLDQRVRGLGQLGVEDARRRVADDITRDERVGAVLQQAAERARRRGAPEGFVDLFPGRLDVQHRREVGQRAVFHRDAHRYAVQLSGQRGDDLAGRTGRTRGRRHHVGRRRPGAAQVLVRAV